MSPALVGALIGLVIAAVEYFVLFPFIYRAIKERAEREGEEFRPPPLMESVRTGQIIVLPVLGYIMGSVLFADVSA